MSQSKSSGSIVGSGGVPKGKIILNAESGMSSYTFTVCLNREVNGSNLTFNYQTTLPKKVGCDIPIADILSRGTYGAEVLGLRPSGEWETIPSSKVSVKYNPTAEDLGCFNVGSLDIYFFGPVTYCDLIVCITGTFALPPCKVIKGCENYCIYVSQGDDALRSQSIRDILLGANPEFTRLIEAIQYVDPSFDLIELLNNDGQFTLFAPTNQAFNNLYTLLSDIVGVPINNPIDVDANFGPGTMVNIVTYHLLNGFFLASDFSNGQVILMANVQNITISKTSGITLNGQNNSANIIDLNIIASNGVIHVIDNVLIPNI